jgi:hypothetical protein
MAQDPANRKNQSIESIIKMAEAGLIPQAVAQQYANEYLEYQNYLRSKGGKAEGGLVQKYADGGAVSGFGGSPEEQLKRMQSLNSGASAMDMVSSMRQQQQPTGGSTGGWSQDSGGVMRKNIGGIDNIVDPNAPGYKEFTGSGSQGYGTFTNSDGKSFSSLGGASGGGNWAAQRNAASVQDTPFRAAGNVAGAPLDYSSSRGYAQGGPINVGGRQVLGAGTGKSDSIPAVIDGEQPAALSTGEFVMPIEAVQHFGLDRLNKMVAAARKGLDTGRDQA